MALTQTLMGVMVGGGRVRLEGGGEVFGSGLMREGVMYSLVHSLVHDHFTR